MDDQEMTERAQRVEAAFARTEDIDFSAGQWIGLLAAGLVFLAAIAGTVLAVIFGTGEFPLLMTIGAACLALIAVAFAAAIYFTGVDDRNARRRFWQQEEISRTIAAGDENSSLSLQNLFLLNRQEMTTYHELTMDQARRSFSNSLVAMWLGFLLVAACVLVVALPGLADPAKLTVAALGSVGTIVSGFVTRTFLKQRALSIDQLNRFFDQPLVTSYLLTAERVALELSEPERSAPLDLVINSALAAARDRGANPPAATSR